MAAPHRFLFEDLPAGFASLNCPELPRSGVHLDYRTRTAGVWTIEALEGFLDRPHAHWPGWQWHLWGADIREQLTRCDRRLTVPPLPAQLTTAITVIASATFEDTCLRGSGQRAPRGRRNRLALFLDEFGEGEFEVLAG